MDADTPVVAADPSVIINIQDQNPTEPPLNPVPHVGSNKPFVHHEFTFPPFPSIPEGVIIIPFSQFKESGISIEEGPDGDEVDSFGIPTVPMSKRHDNDECKTKATKRKGEWDSKGRKKKKGSKFGAGGPALAWWEVWEDGEITRWATSHDPNSSRYERLHAVCADFTEKRQWPAISRAETGPKYVWEKFRRYLGVSDTVSLESATKRKKRRKMFGPDSEDESSSDEVNSKHEEQPRNHDNNDDNDPAVCDETNPAPNTQKNTGVIDPTALLVQKAYRLSEEKMYSFFEDPEKSLKVFMSSHGRRIGLYWSDDNLDIIPRLLRFFVNFVLRSKVLPEIERELKKSLAVLEIALGEMPASSTLSKHMPDRFSEACRSSWGRKTEAFYFSGDSWSSTVDPAIPIDTHPIVQVVGAGSGLAETPQHDSDLSGNIGTQNNTADTATATSNGWAGWGDAPTTESGENDNDNPWGRDPELVQQDADDISKMEQLDAELWAPIEENIISLLGPTTLLLTHKAAVVERSMRIIKAIVPPGPNIPLDIIQTTFALESPAIELELERRFTKVVLGPSETGWDGGESPVYSRPEILSTSQGAVIDGHDGALEPPEALPGATPPHHPHTDDITLLVEKGASYVKDLQVGMGLGGTWVQIARDVLPKKKKGKKLKPAPSLWYVSELNMVIPSFWTVPDTSQSK